MKFLFSFFSTAGFLFFIWVSSNFIFGEKAFSFEYFNAAKNQFLYLLKLSGQPADVIVGGGDFLFLSHNNADDYFRKKKYRNVASQIKNLEVLSKRVGVPIFLYSPPSKASIYKNQLPERFLKESSPYSGIQKAVANSSIGISNATELISVAEKERIYYRWDTHWTTYGAYLGYRALMSKISLDLPLSSLTESQLKFESKGRHGGDLRRLLTGSFFGQSSFTYKEVESIAFTNEALNYEYVLLDKANFIITGTEQSLDNIDVTPHKQPVQVINSNALNIERALIISDSFVRSASIFFNDTFSNVLYAHPEHIDATEKMLKLLELQKPDLLILFITERQLGKLLNSTVHHLSEVL